jgi:hypothetical protein
MSDPRLDRPTDGAEMSTPELLRAVLVLQRRIHKTLRVVVYSVTIVAVLVIAMNAAGLLRSLRDVHEHQIRNEQAHDVQACLLMTRPDDPPASYRSDVDLARCREQAARTIRELFGASAEDLGTPAR